RVKAVSRFLMQLPCLFPEKNRFVLAGGKPGPGGSCPTDQHSNDEVNDYRRGDGEKQRTNHCRPNHFLERLPVKVVMDPELKPNPVGRRRSPQRPTADFVLPKID